MEVEWHLNTEFPKDAGYYLITELDYKYGMLVWQTKSAYWTGSYWDYSGVFAWAELPEPFVAWDADLRAKLWKQVEENNRIYKRFNKRAKKDTIECPACGHQLQKDWNWCPYCKYEVARIGASLEKR